MNAIELLTTRSSMPRLIGPAPTDADLQIIEKAALRVPDHMALLPFSCHVVEGEGLQQLGQLFYKAATTEQGFRESDQQRAAQLPLRAPMIIVVSTRYQPHPSVPPVEQLATAACATMAMQQACFALGYGAIWRTGPYAQSATVKQGLNIAQGDEVVGFLYIGTAAVPTPIKPEREVNLFKPAKMNINP